MVKKLLVLLAASALVSLVSFTVLNMMGGFKSLGDGGPWNLGSWGEWHDNRDAGPETTRDLAYAGSPRLDIYYPSEITYTQGDQPRFTVTGPKALLDQLRLENDQLTIGDHHFRGSRSDDRLRIEVVAPSLHEFHLTGAQQLTIRKYDQDELRVYAAGAADVEGEGKARRLEVSVAGAGHVSLDDLPVDEARVQISGAGDASIDARRSSDVSISGAGHVELKCRPTDAHAHTAGFGSVDYGADCTAAPATPAPPASSAPPADTAAPAPKSKI
ncbi:MAG TPA: DUF2807 domain-containing protein [Caulobacteraceae bacterium]|jgi:hypothetical protein